MSTEIEYLEYIARWITYLVILQGFTVGMCMAYIVARWGLIHND